MYARNVQNEVGVDYFYSHIHTGMKEALGRANKKIPTVEYQSGLFL